jgi:small subunit ribosomal protein S8
MDHLANMLVSVTNAAKVYKTDVVVRHNSVCEEVAKILVSEGYVANYIVEGETQKSIRITLKYETNGNGVIRNMRRVSKSSLRQYSKSSSIPDVKNGLGLLIISTNKGIMTGRQARSQNLGGEVLMVVDE